MKLLSLLLQLLVVVLLCVVPTCVLQGQNSSNCLDVSNTENRECMLSFRPKVLILSKETPSRTVRVECTYGNTTNVKTFDSLQLSRRTTVPQNSGYTCMVESNATCYTSLLCAQNQRACSNNATTALGGRMEASGNHATSLFLTLPDASCDFGNYVYRCNSVVTTQGPVSSLQHSKQIGALSVKAVEPKPSMTVLLSGSPAAGGHHHAVALNTDITLTCSATMGLTQDSEQATWVWETSENGGGGGGWTVVSSISSTTERVGCVVSGTSTLSTKIEAISGTCRWRFRCYVVRGDRCFVGTAAQHVVRIVGCQVVSQPAIALASAGGAMLGLAVLALLVVVVVRKRLIRSLVKDEAQRRADGVWGDSSSSNVSPSLEEEPGAEAFAALDSLEVTRDMLRRASNRHVHGKVCSGTAVDYYGALNNADKTLVGFSKDDGPPNPVSHRGSIFQKMRSHERRKSIGRKASHTNISQT